MVEDNVGGTDGAQDNEGVNGEEVNHFAMWLRKIAEVAERDGIHATGGVVLANIPTEKGSTVASWNTGLSTSEVVGVLEYSKAISMGLFNTK